MTLPDVILRATTIAAKHQFAFFDLRRKTLNFNFTPNTRLLYSSPSGFSRTSVAAI
jgi:hypothetical protein